jgi:short-subunit dehydrogenase
MKKAVIFGASGGIGQAILYSMQHQFEIIMCGRSEIDLSDFNSDQLIQEFLNQHQPDIVINSAGILGSDSQSHHDTMDVNFGSNWSIIKYCTGSSAHLPTKIIMIGSTACRGPRARYMLYAASKAAVYSLWQSARDWADIGSRKISIDLINPPRVKTQMSRGLSIDNAIDPQDVAKLVLSRLSQTDSVCIDMDHKELL